MKAAAVAIAVLLAAGGTLGSASAPSERAPKARLRAEREAMPNRGQDPKITIKHQPRQGDRLVMSMSRDISFVIPFKGREERFSLELDQKTAVEFLEVSDGRLKSKSVDFQEMTWTRRLPLDRKPVTEPDVLHQRKLTISTVGGKIAVTGAHNLPGRVVDKMDLLSGEEYVITFPPKPVAVGDDWKIAGDDYARVSNDPGLIAGFAFMTLKDVREIDGKRCAVIDYDEQLSTRRAEGLLMDISIRSEITVWLDRGYILSIKGSGSVKVDDTIDGKETHAEGPIDIEVSTVVEEARK